jgi:hypothetical protein
VTPNPITDTRANGPEKSLLRFIASSARPLKKDAALTPLGAFDILQRVHRKYQTLWWSIWIVCMDGYSDITPSMPIQHAIKTIEAHGGAAGIVGLTVIARTFTFLKKPLKAGNEVRGLLDWSGNKAADRFLEITERMAALKHIATGETMKIQ